MRWISFFTGTRKGLCLFWKKERWGRGISPYAPILIELFCIFDSQYDHNVSEAFSHIGKCSSAQYSPNTRRACRKTYFANQIGYHSQISILLMLSGTGWRNRFNFPGLTWVETGSGPRMSCSQSWERPGTIDRWSSRTDDDNSGKMSGSLRCRSWLLRTLTGILFFLLFTWN